LQSHVFSTTQVRNISTKPYGRKAQQSLSSVTLLLHVSPLMIFVPHQRRFLKFDIPFLDPGACLEFTFSVKLLDKAKTRFFAKESWGMKLLLRDKVIEDHEYPIRITPVFIPHKKTDVCLITHKGLDHGNFIAWNQVMVDLNLSYNMWDLQRYGGCHDQNSRITWIGMCTHVIVPASDSKVLKVLDFSAIFLHLRGHKVDLGIYDDNSTDGSGKRHGMLFTGQETASDLDVLLFDFEEIISGGGGDEACSRYRTSSTSAQHKEAAMKLLHARDKIRFTESKQRALQNLNDKQLRAHWTRCNWISCACCCYTPNERLKFWATKRECGVRSQSFMASAYRYKNFWLSQPDTDCCVDDYKEHVVLRSVSEITTPIFYVKDIDLVKKQSAKTLPFVPVSTGSDGHVNYDFRKEDKKGRTTLQCGPYLRSLFAVYCMLDLKSQIHLATPNPNFPNRVDFYDFQITIDKDGVKMSDLFYLALAKRVFLEFKAGEGCSRKSKNDDSASEVRSILGFPSKNDLIKLKEEKVQLPHVVSSYVFVEETVAEITNCLCCNGSVSRRLRELRNTIHELESKGFGGRNPTTVNMLKHFFYSSREALQFRSPFLDDANNVLFSGDRCAPLSKMPITKIPGYQLDSNTYHDTLTSQQKAWQKCTKTLQEMTQQKTILQENVVTILRIYDKNGDGHLDHAELKWAVEKDPILAKYLGVDPKNPTQFNEIFAKIDSDGSGTIDITELDAALSKFNQGRQGEAINITSISGTLENATPLMVLAEQKEEKVPSATNIEAWKKYDVHEGKTEIDFDSPT